MIYENKSPNSPFCPAIMVALGDENDDASNAIIFQKLGPYFKDLKDNRIVLDGIKIKCLLFHQMDGKSKSKVTGHSGSSSDYNCQICFATKKGFDREDMKKASNICHNIVTNTRWNFKKKASLYNEAKGCEKYAFFDIEPSELVPDCLHIILNMQSWYEDAVIKNMAYTHIDDQEACEDLFLTTVKDTRLSEAETRYKQMVKSEMKFSRSVAEKRQNPGRYCKTWFEQSVLDKIFSLINDSVPKKDLLENIQTFCKMKRIFLKKEKTHEDAVLYCNLKDEWIRQKKEKLNYLSDTNTTHNLVVHIPHFLKNSALPLSLLDFSTEGWYLKYPNIQFLHLNF